jgi:hypothetical protein
MRHAMSSTEKDSIGTNPAASVLRDIHLPAVLSFLKDMRGVITWTPEDVVRVLGGSLEDANKILAFLQSQGYVTPSENGRWVTTSSGHIDSGSRLPVSDCKV